MYVIVGAPGTIVLAGVEMETEPAGLEPPASTLTTLTVYVVSGCSCPSVTVVTVLLTVEVNVGTENRRQLTCRGISISQRGTLSVLDECIDTRDVSGKGPLWRVDCS
jgi:hypothetical protein